MSCSTKHIQKDLPLNGDYYKIDTENRIIFICDARNRIHKYLFDGTYLNTITFQSPNSKAIFIQFYNDRLYSTQDWWEKSNDNSMLLEIDPSDGKIISDLQYYRKLSRDCFINELQVGHRERGIRIIKKIA